MIELSKSELLDTLSNHNRMSVHTKKKRETDELTLATLRSVLQAYEGGESQRDPFMIDNSPTRDDLFVSDRG